MSEHLRIDAAEALAESPAFLEPLENVRLTCWVGGAERAPSFIRQDASAPQYLDRSWRRDGGRRRAGSSPHERHRRSRGSHA